MQNPADNISSATSYTTIDKKVHRLTVLVLILLMCIELVVSLVTSQWLSAFLVTMILVVVLLPLILKNKFDVIVPAEFHLLAVIFLFAALFLGEIRDFYERIWWWDMALHAVAGILMGILGFLLIYLLNESKWVDFYMTPGFMAFFAFIFAVATGAVWEIFEFTMDQLFGTNMQKPMWGDPSGLTDTMWDMIVNAIGAIIISVMGWLYMRKRERFIVMEWIHKFIEKNPGLFRN